jgi:hypothetical protein
MPQWCGNRSGGGAAASAGASKTGLSVRWADIRRGGTAWAGSEHGLAKVTIGYETGPVNGEENDQSPNRLDRFLAGSASVILRSVEMQEHKACCAFSPGDRACSSLT